ncbi:MAG: fructose-6-phosphate aldolase [Kiloniellales bacterium]|jgi:transaldolase|nr:fructose-6-phosphate aldolase [Kiloniellales bacterium]
MKFFVDTADVAEIRDLSATGLLDGVTTNPSLVAKTGRDFIEVLKEICALVSGPVSAEVTALDHPTMVSEGRRLAQVADNIAVKVPLTPDGLKACRALSDDGIRVNVTLCFSPAQALLAAKAGASFVSPFVGRLDDIATDGIGLISEIMEIFDAYPEITTEVLVASVRHPIHVVEAAKLGAHVATVPPAVLRAMFKHPLTDRGLDSFLDDWAKTGQSILKQPVAGESDDKAPERRRA